MRKITIILATVLGVIATSVSATTLPAQAYLPLTEEGTPTDKTWCGSYPPAIDNPKGCDEFEAAGIFLPNNDKPIEFSGVTIFQP